MLRIQIPNYSQYQHYADRMPPWIKIHKKLLDDYKFMSLKSKEQMLLICLWILASENPIEEDCGLVKLQALDELVWRLRHLEAVKAGGADSLKVLKAHGFLQFRDEDLSPEKSASTALAPRTREREGEGERETEGERTPEVKPREAAVVPAKKVSKKSWAREAAEDWDEQFGKGSSAPGRIGAALTPLVKEHGWPVVRPVWKRYLGEKDPEYCNPQDFKAKFKVWLDGTSHRVGGAAIEAENKREIGRFLEGEKGLPSERGLASLPPAKGT